MTKIPGIVNITECLPADVRAGMREITPIAAGLSGADVYLVKTDTTAFVLKIARDDNSPESFRRRARIQQAAGERGVGPRVVHADVERHAILTTFIEDCSFAILYFNPATHDAALQHLARTLRTIHAMDPRDAAASNKPREILDLVWNDLKAVATVPAFVAATVEQVRGLQTPADSYEMVLSHNDVNPSNILFDGERVVLLDWDVSGAGDPYYDLASASVFFRMDDATCVKLLSYHDEADVYDIPARFRYNQCLVAGLCGSMFVRLATNAGYSVSVDPEAITALADIYGMMRSGSLDVSSAEGQFKFGLALLAEAKRYAGLLEQT